jgi:hypothetical protein
MKVKLHGTVLVKAVAHATESRHGSISNPTEFIAHDGCIAIVVVQEET